MGGYKNFKQTMAKHFSYNQLANYFWKNILTLAYPVYNITEFCFLFITVYGKNSITEIEKEIEKTLQSISLNKSSQLLEASFIVPLLIKLIYAKFLVFPSKPNFPIVPCCDWNIFIKMYYIFIA